jgi:hypothetical protein
VALLAAVEVDAFEERARQAFEWQTSLAGMQAPVSKGVGQQNKMGQTPEPITDPRRLEIGYPVSDLITCSDFKLSAILFM